MKTNYLFNLHVLQRICVVLLIGSGALGLFGATVNAANAVTAPWNGSGTEADPYLVRSAADLQSLSDFCRNGNATKGYFWLMTQDIDMSSITNFTPIGGRDQNDDSSSNMFFQGTFDGGGHVLSRLTIDNLNKTYTGMFGWTASSTIRNLGVVDANVKGGFYTGILSGMNIGKIYNCYTTGTVNGISNTGGLTGYIASQGNGSFGSGWGQIYNCYTTAQVVAGSNGDAAYFGTFAGGCDKATISNCFATGTIDGQVTKGGFVGQANASTFTNCHFRQETGVNENLAFIGKVNTANTLSNSDAKTGADMQLANFVSELNGSTGEILWTSKSSVNNGYPILFYQAGIRTITYSANGATNTMPVQLVGENSAVRLLTNTLIPATLQRSANWKVTTSTATNITVGTLFDNNALITLNGGNITLEPQWENLSGDGSETNPYKISAPADLRALSNYVMGGNNCSDTYFIMTADIDMANERDFIPIGGHESLIQSNGNIVFEGNFSGGNHVIRNLILNMPNSDYVGLFGAIGVNANIKNLGIAQAHITASGTAGVVAGLSRGTISSCYADATVLSNGYQGVLAGLCYGTINNCYATGSLTGNQYTGGLAGGLAGIIKNCYSAVSIHDTNGGGLAGYFFGNANLTNCYYLQESGGVNDGLAVVGTNVYGTINNTMPKTGTELKDAAMVTTLNGNAGSAVWRADLVTAINDGYPILMWQGPVCTVQFKAGTGTGSMNDMMLPAGEVNKLNANSFSATGAALFQEWKVTASTVAGIAVGTVYTDQQEITPGTGILELTAQWKLAFTNGDGTAESPYLIQTPADLIALNTYVSQNGNTTNFYWQLTADLDMTGIQNFLPIGALAEDSDFNGTLDGKGHKITNLTIQSSIPGVGLFLSVGHRGKVTNLGIGSGCSFSLNTTSDDVVFAGGIAATNMGIIGNCYSTVNMTISNTGDLAIGSIAGANQGRIINCYATANLSGTIGEDAKINAIGGITGYNAGKVSSGYFTGSIITSAGTGTSNIAGGIVGYNVSLSGSGKIKSKSPGIVAGSVSKVAAANGGSLEIGIDNCYFLQEGSINQGLNGVGLGPDGGAPRTSGQLKDAAMPGILNAMVYNHTWAADSNNSNNGYPVITLNGYQWDWAGDGTEQTPWMIGSGEQLDELRVYINVAGYPTIQHHWKLSDDIDLVNFANFTPIGTTGAGSTFDGVFDGDGYVISNLQINQNSEANNLAVGLFGCIGSSGIIQNVGVVSGSIKFQAQNSYCFAGAIAGYNGGSILNCFNRATIQVTNDYYNFIGGIAGSNEGTVSNCFNTGDITVGSPDASCYTGGIVGDNYGVVSYCYNTANVSNSASEAVTGGVVGANESGLAVTACYYLQEGSVNSGINGIGDPASGNNATAQTSNGLRDATVLAALNASQSPAPWKADFNPAINGDYPILIWQTSTLTGSATAKPEALLFYPNPAKNYLMVKGMSGQVQIFDFSGRLVLSEQITRGERMNISALAKGIYTVKAGGKTMKLLKE